LIPLTLKIGNPDPVPGKPDLLGLREKEYESFVLSDRPIVLAFLKIVFGKLKLTVGIEENRPAGIRIGRQETDCDGYSGHNPSCP
jgi:hypothetical protein